MLGNNFRKILFDYVEEDGTIKKAEVLTLFTVEGSEKQYALCSIPAIDGNFDITAFIMNELADGTVRFDDIESEEKLNKVTAVVNDMME